MGKRDGRFAGKAWGEKKLTGSPQCPLPGGVTVVLLLDGGRSGLQVGCTENMTFPAEPAQPEGAEAQAVARGDS